MRKMMMAATALTVLAAPAFAVDVKLYGTVNKAVMAVNDGRSNDVSFVDNSNETTRFGLAGEKKLDNGLTASVLFEAQHNSNPSNSMTQGTWSASQQSRVPTSAGNPGLAERIARVGLGGAWGAVFLGQQDVASDDGFTHDLAPASSILNANVGSFGGGYIFQRSTAAGVWSNLQLGGQNMSISQMAMGMNGDTDATDAIRYNSPVWMGLNGSASIAQGGNVDVNARYAKEYKDLSVDGAIAYKFKNDGATTASNVDQGTLTTSWSVKHKSGFAGTVAYVQKTLDKKAAGVNTPKGYYVKGGYAWDAYGVAVDYANFKNAALANGSYSATDSELSSYGVAGEYDLGNGVVAGAMYRNFDAKVAGVSNDKKIDLFAVNMRVKF